MGSIVDVSSPGRGVTLGTLDLIIGATAIRHCGPVLTASVADFCRMPGCAVEALKQPRIDNSWRVVFRWMDSGPAEVDLRDRH